MAWDCHVHLFGPRSRFPFQENSPYVSDDALPEDYLRVQEALGLQRAVIVSAGGYGKDTRHIRSVLEQHRQRFRGVILPPDDFARNDVAELHALGVRGVRMFGGPEGHEWSHLPQFDTRIAAIIHEAGWHIQYHSLVLDEIIESARRLLALPNRIVIDHCGMVDPRAGTRGAAFKVLRSMLDTGRVWIKLSGPMRCERHAEFPYPAMKPIAQALVRHAPERMLWGSDWPHVQMNGRQMPNDGDLLDLFGEWVPDASIRKLILSQNPLALYA